MHWKRRLKRAMLALLGIPTPGIPLAPQVVREPTEVLNNRLLAGNNILITGAGRNIGRAIAHALAQQGANIFFTDIDPQRIQWLERELNQYFGTSKGFLADITNHEDSDRLATGLRQDNRSIDVLVNNVGSVFSATGLEQLETELWQRTFATNVFGPIHLTRLIAQTMLEQQIAGNIIFITSTHQWTVFRQASYSASKAALGMLIKELAVELAPHSIRVNGIAPGWVAEDGDGQPIPYGTTLLHGTSITPCYIARSVLYLASEYFSRHTTGTVVTVDGGLSLYSHIMR